MNGEMEVEVFRAGDYGPKGAWDEAALERIAGDYDPALHEAPVTLDHAQRGPAMGWVASVRRAGDRLFARLRGVNDRLVSLVREGAYRKRSVELYPAFKGSGGPYLKAVSFLGAAAPEVKGMADPIPGASGFGDDGGEAIAIAMGEENGEENGADTKEEEKNNQSHSSAAPFSAFDEVERRLKAEGRWRPGWAGRGVDCFYEALSQIDEIEVGEGQTVAPAEWFREFLMGLPPVVEMGEHAPAAHVNGAQPPAMAFGEAAFTRGGAIDPASADLHRRAVAFQNAHPGTDYREALVRTASVN